MRVVVYPEPTLRAPLYYRSSEARDLPPPAVSTHTPWSAPRTVAPYPLVLQFQGIIGADVPVAPPAQNVEAAAWRPPLVYRFRSTAAAFYTMQTSEDATGQAAAAQVASPPAWLGRPFTEPPLVTLYLFSRSAQDPPPPAGVPTVQGWLRPRTAEPTPLVVRFQSAQPGDVPAAPTPTDSPTTPWRPQFVQPTIAPRPWLYIQNPATDPTEETAGQFTVFWQYQTQYEALVRRAFYAYWQEKEQGFPSIVEPPTFPGWLAKPLSIPVPPAITRLLYRQAPPQDFNFTPEIAAYPGWIAKPLWPFQAPPGTYMYYRQAGAQDVPPPKPTPVSHGHPSILYMRRLELLGSRGWGP